MKRNNVIKFPPRLSYGPDSSDRPILPASAIQRSPELSLIEAILTVMAPTDLAQVVRNLDDKMMATGADDGHDRAALKFATEIFPKSRY